MNYTKGTWAIRDGKVQVMGRGVIAETPTPNTNGVFEFVANRQLIAAAPELYEALLNSQTMLRTYSFAHPTDVILGALITENAKALAKAQGELANSSPITFEGAQHGPTSLSTVVDAYQRLKDKPQ